MSTPHGSLRSTFLVQLIRASILYGSLVCISAGRDGRGRGKDRRRNNEIPLIQSSSKGKDRRRNNGIPLTQSPSNASSLEVFGREHHAAPPFVPASALGRSGADAAFALVASDSCAHFGYLPLTTAIKSSCQGARRHHIFF